MSTRPEDDNDDRDQDSGPASEPSGAAEESTPAEQEDPDAGPASEPS